jgi:hypothetical protein
MIPVVCSVPNAAVLRPAPIDTEADRIAWSFSNRPNTVALNPLPVSVPRTPNLTCGDPLATQSTCTHGPDVAPVNTSEVGGSEGTPAAVDAAVGAAVTGGVDPLPSVAAAN